VTATAPMTPLPVTPNCEVIDTVPMLLLSTPALGAFDTADAELVLAPPLAPFDWAPIERPPVLRPSSELLDVASPWVPQFDDA